MITRHSGTAAWPSSFSTSSTVAGSGTPSRFHSKPATTGKHHRMDHGVAHCRDQSAAQAVRHTCFARTRARQVVLELHLRPMETEFAGEPVAGGTYPAMIFKRFVESAMDLGYGKPGDVVVPVTPVTPVRRRRPGARARRAGARAGDGPGVTAPARAVPEETAPVEPAPEEQPAPEPPPRRRRPRRRARPTRRRPVGRRLSHRDGQAARRRLRPPAAAAPAATGARRCASPARRSARAARPPW